MEFLAEEAVDFVAANYERMLIYCSPAHVTAGEKARTGLCDKSQEGSEYETSYHGSVANPPDDHDLFDLLARFLDAVLERLLGLLLGRADAHRVAADHRVAHRQAGLPDLVEERVGVRDVFLRGLA